MSEIDWKSICPPPTACDKWYVLFVIFQCFEKLSLLNPLSHTVEDKNKEKCSVVKSFEERNAQLRFKRCDYCRSVSLLETITQDRITKKYYCKFCKNISGKEKQPIPQWLPIWIDEHGQTKFNVPKELEDLREGEKLMIQLVSPYVPLQHMKMGAHGCNGHVCCFPTDISYIAKTLPKTRVEAIKVVKHYKKQNGETGSTVFKIRRSKVMKALYWLKKFNKLYHDVEIVEENLSWMENNEEAELNVAIVNIQETEPEKHKEEKKETNDDGES